MSHGLRPRTSASAEEVALISAAVVSLMTPPAAVVDAEDVTAWRFSGRWFAHTHVSSLRRPQLG